MNERFKNLNGISDIVDAMIKGLRKKWVEVDMSSFGDVYYADDKPVCFGCAATNTVCELMQEPFTISTIGALRTRTKQFNYGVDEIELRDFEYAIDELRKGYTHTFQYYLKKCEKLFSFKVPDSEGLYPPNRDLPYLSNGTYIGDLPEYEQYRDWLKAKGL